MSCGTNLFAPRESRGSQWAQGALWDLCLVQATWSGNARAERFVYLHSDAGMSAGLRRTTYTFKIIEGRQVSRTCLFCNRGRLLLIMNLFLGQDVCF